MFVIRSKKTGKTFLRLTDWQGYEWVMFREEEPTVFEGFHRAAAVLKTYSLDAEILPFHVVPLQNPPSEITEPELTEKDEAKFRANHFPEY